MTRYRNHSLSCIYRPSWAWGTGDDTFGPFAEIRLAGVVYRMRRVPPGVFRMGSPVTEDGRFEHEGPRHTVQLTQGFWLGETPCTQELWQAVAGKNPSRHRGPELPVEQVSWDDCNEFLEKAESLQPGIRLRLPTEAQWEYACRAGTSTATWKGDLEILDENNAPILDEIAWYRSNTSVDIDLGKRFDSSGWPRMRYPITSIFHTRRVQLLKPNPWGFYDMLGNVWEWCCDHVNNPMPSYAGEPRSDPVESQGSHRVIRGGAWSDQARYVRAACRYGYDPGGRHHDLGFRLSRGSD